MIKKLIIFVLLTNLPLLAFGEHLPIHKKQKLSEARKSLLKAGWKPYHFFDDSASPKEISGMAKGYFDAGFVEVADCGVGNPDCAFNYRKGKQCLHVLAGSYEGPVNESTVTEWSNECEEQWWK